MKKVVLLFLNILVATFIFAQTPQMFKYQAVIRNTSGTIISNEEIAVDITILQDDLITSVFEESHTVTTNSQGLINLNIGSIEDLSVVDWSSDTYFIEITVNGTVMGTSQLLSVPYAINSKYAESANYNSLINLPDLFDGNYNSLNNTPEIPADISDLTDNNGLLSNGFSGDYNDLINLPELFDGNYENLSNSPDFTNWDTDNTDDFSGSYDDLTNKPDFSGWDTDASDDFSGSYNDLSDKPSIPADLADLTDNTSLLFSKSYNDLTDKPDFTGWDTDVSDDFSGSYDDLSNKPSIPASLSDLSDISTSGVTSGQTLTYNGSTWEPSSPAGWEGDETKIYIDKKVGIGTTTPSSKFEVNTIPTENRYTDISTPSSGNTVKGNAYQSFYPNTSGYLNSIEFKMSLLSGSTSVTCTISVYEGRGTSGNLLVTASGFFTNTTTSFQKFEFMDTPYLTAGAEYTFYIQPSSNIWYNIQANSTYPGVCSIYSTNDMSFKVKLNSDPKEKTLNVNSGKIGVGVDSPSEKLDIDGGIKIGDGSYTSITDGATTPVPNGGAGTIIFSDSHFYGWDGTAWQQLD